MQEHFTFENKKERIIIGGDDENTKALDKTTPLYFDGYSIAERQLEGVIFKVTLDKDGLGGTISLKDQDDESYIKSKLSYKKVVKGAIDFCQKNDIFYLSGNQQDDTDEDQVVLDLRENYPDLIEIKHKQVSRLV